ncbi:MAG: hypothetical protein LBP95_12985 [Deltaproteobacteria bacterium]|jgi:hypothetical protein|nr:hypothetical protein [Deltaproteobacteria bacterium]
MLENQTSSNSAVRFYEPRKDIKDDILMSTNRLVDLKEVLSLISISSNIWKEGIKTEKYTKTIKISKIFQSGELRYISSH